jgi:flagellar biosynthesis protein
MRKNDSKINAVKSESPPKKGIAKAVALKYDGVKSPELVAKGQGDLAYEIVALAKENDVHIHYDPLLLDVLTKLELGDKIPETLYLAVAKIIAFAYYLQGKHPEGKKAKAAEQTSIINENTKKITTTLPKDIDQK